MQEIETCNEKLCEWCNRVSAKLCWATPDCCWTIHLLHLSWIVVSSCREAFFQLTERATSTYPTSRATRSRNRGRPQARILRVLWQLWIMEVPAKQEITSARKGSRNPLGDRCCGRRILHPLCVRAVRLRQSENETLGARHFCAEHGRCLVYA